MICWCVRGGEATRAGGWPTVVEEPSEVNPCCCIVAEYRSANVYVQDWVERSSKLLQYLAFVSLSLSPLSLSGCFSTSRVFSWSKLPRIIFHRVALLTFQHPAVFQLHSTAVPEQLWAEFQNHSLSVLRQLPPDDERLKEIPPQFYAAFPLDDASKTRGTAGSFGYPSETYKV